MMSRKRIERRSARDMAEIGGTLLLAVALAGLGLRALDALPGLLRGEGRGIVRVDSLEAAERLFGAPLVLPSLFPETIGWPPAAVLVHTRPPTAVVLVFTGRDGRTERLRMCEVRGAAVSLDLMPAARSLHRVTVEMPGAAERAAILERVQMPDGSIGHDLVWRGESLTVLLRYAGSADELVAIARSLRRRRP